MTRKKPCSDSSPTESPKRPAPESPPNSPSSTRSPRPARDWPPSLSPVIASPPPLPTRIDAEQPKVSTEEEAETQRRQLLRQTLLSPDWMTLSEAAMLRAMQPTMFRRHLRILPREQTSSMKPAAADRADSTSLSKPSDTAQPATLGQLIQPFQAADFAALDPAWLRLTGWNPRNEPGTTRGKRTGKRGQARKSVNRFWIERPRGHSKTTDTAAMLLWVLAFSRVMVRGVAAAADRDQARLILDQMAYLIELNPDLADRVRIQRDRATGPASRSRLEVVSSDAASSYGTIADFIICDELCHWARPELWHSLYTASAKQPHTVLAVLTNAGHGRDWRWAARERARQSAGWHFSSLQGPQASWIDADFLAEQRASLPETVYRRLWLNEWQDRGGGFLKPDEVRLCRDINLAPQDRGRPGITYLAAIDYAEKHDRTAAIVAHLEPPSETHPRVRVIVDRLDVVAPSPDQPTPIAWVDEWITSMADAFPGIRFVVDEHQLLGTVQRFEGRVPIERFAFAGGAGNDALARNLRTMILSRDVLWYPGCGRVESTLPTVSDSDPSDDPTGDDSLDDDTLESELCDLLVLERSGGRLRFDHPPGRHDDRAFVLAVACLHLVRIGRQADFFTVDDFDLALPADSFGRSLRLAW